MENNHSATANNDHERKTLYETYTDYIEYIIN